MVSFRDLRLRAPLYEQGFILSSMATKPLDIAVKAFTEFIDANAGDTFIFKNLYKIVRHVIKKLIRILGCPDSLCSGYIVSGGSEANFLSLWLLRNYAIKTKN
ncbi:MAG: hypothetical protein B6U75_04470 [Desulfurococcales archaeon ex4484_217_1]|nr:MAG: hypothetical protein B6U75_04470 [Desulfurococcales archaeon ex4484_217_1]